MVRVGQLLDHLGAGAPEVDLAQLQVIRPAPVDQGLALLHPVPAGDPHVVALQDPQAPEGEEDVHLEAGGGGRGGEDQDRPHPVEIAAPTHDRHALLTVVLAHRQIPPGGSVD